jgi:hypothetical protein
VQPHKRQRYHWVFTDIKHKKEARYEAVVRDKNGVLRSLSHKEYMQLRKSTSPAISGSPFTYTNKPAGGYWMNDAERAVWQAAQTIKREKELALARLQFLTRKQVDRAIEWKRFHESRAAAGTAPFHPPTLPTQLWCLLFAAQPLTCMCRAVYCVVCCCGACIVCSFAALCVLCVCG